MTNEGSVSQQEQHNGKKRRINWHHAMYEVLHIELEEYLEHLQFYEEYHLGRSRESLRADVLVVRKCSDIHIRKQFASIFQKYNIIEYKSPEDTLTVDDYYKTIGYGCIFRFQTGKVNEVACEDITITYIASHFPRKIKAELAKRKIRLEKRTSGIYDVIGEIFRVQIIINRELDMQETLWLRCLDNRLKDKKYYEALSYIYAYHKDEPRYSTPMNAIIRSNCKQKGERDIMCEALYELFADNLEEREERGFARGEESGEIKGEVKGRICSLIEFVCRKLRKGKSAELIAQELDTDYETVKNICDAAREEAPEYDCERIYEKLSK